MGLQLHQTSFTDTNPLPSGTGFYGVGLVADGHEARFDDVIVSAN